jgi:prevent-host-death family protein
MRRISIRELHIDTGRWVRNAAASGPLIITERGRPIAALQPYAPHQAGRPLPNRERAIRARARIAVDSGALLLQDRGGR